MYAIIPMSILRCKDLPPKAILLYGEIQTLANIRGYCWATNQWFADRYDLSPRTVSELIGKLVRKGFLTLEMHYRVPPHNTTQRWLRVAPPEEIPQEPVEETCQTLQAEIPHHNNTRVNNKNNPPKAPQGAKENLLKPKWKPDRFQGFWNLYPRGEAKQAAMRAWDKLRPDEQLLHTMGVALIYQMSSPQWQMGFAVPYASTWLSQGRWEDKLFTPPDPEEKGGWAESEVL